MKKGFTLIELLAVIVILAIIALIATPIVLSIINDSKESATLRSAEFYVDAVSNAIMQRKLKDPMFTLSDGVYTVMTDGNICLGTYGDNMCTGDVLEIEIDNQRPRGGTIEISNLNIKDYELMFDGKTVVNGEFVENIEQEPTPAECFETTELADGTLEINQYLCDYKDVLIPNEIDGKKVTVIGVYDAYDEYGEPMGELGAFDGNNLTSVIIPNSVTTIVDRAFANNNLTSVTIPNSVTSIGIGAFNDNQLPDSQAFIYARNSDGSIDYTTLVSYGGAKRDNVTIPDSVTAIGASAFYYDDLTGVIIPDSVISIGYRAFFGCASLTSVTIGNSVTTIGEEAFRDNNLTSVTIPNSVTSIGNDAFDGNNLTSVIIQGKSSTSDFTRYPAYSPFGWASRYSDSNITWQP